MYFKRIGAGLLTFLLHVALVAQGYSVEAVAILPAEIHQTSGLVIINNQLVTHNDGAEGPSLFELDPDDGSIIREVAVVNATNIDWEDISQDNQYIYIADFGNNSGDRTDLRIYTVSLSDFNLGNNSVTVVDTIKFAYEDQVSFIPGNSHNFDAEALIAFGDSLYIFTKHRLDSETNIYSLSKTPGEYQAKKVGNINSQGQISGGTYNTVSGEILLTGYNSGDPFVLQISNFSDTDFDGGTIERFEYTVTGSTQIEAVEAIDDEDYFITSETSTDGGAALLRLNALAPNAAPVVSITAPSDGHTVVEGTDINFAGTASDAEDGDLTDGITWNSSLDGDFGSGGSVDIGSLSVGAHTITASATDADTETGTDQITVTVNGQESEFTSAAQNDVESAGTFTATVQLAGTTDVAVDVPFTVSGTATEGPSDDFTVTGSPVTIPAGQLSADITITINNDTEIEPDETVILTLGAPSLGSLGTITEHTATINDDDVNTAPVVSITAPSDGHTVVEGTDINFAGTASDAEDGDLTDGITWNSSLDGDFGSGGSVDIGSLSVGAHTITASATDADTETGTDQISVTVNGQESEFTSAAQNDVESAGTFTATVQLAGTTDVAVDVPFTVSGTATEGPSDDFTVTGSPVTIPAGQLSADITITINNDTEIEPDETVILTLGAPSLGSLGTITEHTATINDDDVNTAPVVSITAPSDGASEPMATAISFSATANDAQEGDLSASLSWESDVDGAIGSGGSFDYSLLTPGAHVITARVQDTEGLEGSDAVILNITNTAPVVNVTEPSDGISVVAGTSIMFAATAADTEEGDLSPGLTWLASLDGAIGSGPSISTAALSVGTQSITASVTDGGGLSGNDAVTVTVTAVTNPPTATGVSISGTTEVGFTLTGNYTYNDAEGDLESGTTFRWLRNGSPIGSATSQSYTLVGADQGTSIIFEVTPGAATGPTPGTAVQSAAVGPIAPANTAPTASGVSISGTTEVGFTLTGNYTYNDADGDSESGTTFRWLRNGSPIGSATSQSYTLVGADQGTNIIFEVTPAAASGVSPGSAVQSAAVGPIAPANTAPTATGVSISGTAIEGQSLTGQYTYSDADLDPEGTSTFRWLRGNSAISGATSQTYVLTNADVGNNISFEVTPVAQSGVSPGTPVRSTAVGPIQAANAPPTNITLSSSSVPENSTVNTVVGNFSTTDPDNPGDSHTYSLVSGAGSGDNGSFNILNNQLRTSQVFNFEQDNSYSIRVQTEDAAGATFQKAFTITITNVNDLPVAVGDLNNSTTGTASININVAANDTDEDGSVVPSTVTITSNPANGSAVNNGNGTITYTPNAGYEGGDNIEYTIQDNQGATSLPGSVVITVGPNNAPVANDDLSNTTLEDVAITINVITNDTDSDGSIDPASISIATDPSKGSAVANNNGTVTYTPNLNENGTDEFNYSVTDNLGAPSNQARVVININPVNDPPVAVNDSESTAEESPVVIDVLANDNDLADSQNGGALDPTTVNIVNGPANGNAVANTDGTVTYTPADGFNGNDTFTYNVRDNSNAVSNNATVTINVSSVNDPPVAVNDPTNPTTEDNAITINVVANDTDSDGSVIPASVLIVDIPLNGIAVSNNDGTVTYTPNADYNGNDSFSYTVEDDQGAVSNEATVNIQIAGANDPPLAADDLNNSTNEDTPIIIAITSNDTDPDGTLDLTSIIASDPEFGSVTTHNDGTVTYTPDQDFNGSDSFTYTVKDNGGAISNEALVSIVVNDINDPPVAVDDVEITDEDQPVTIDLISNDLDVDGTLIIATLTLQSNVANGTLVNNGNGTATYTPNQNFNGQDSFTYTIDDDDDAVSNVATVNITVNDINDAPVANDDALNTDEDITVTIDVVANDTDADGTIVPSSIMLVAAPGNGTATVKTDGTVEYNPNENYNGLDTFTYTVQDNDGAQSNIATVTISVNDINDALVANDDTVSTNEDTAVIIDILQNDVDPDNPIDATSVTIVTSTMNGQAVVNANGTVTYTPNPLFNGNDSFTYNVKNTGGQVSNIATVIIMVSDINNLPTAVSDSAKVFEDEVSTLNILENDTDVDGTIGPEGVTIVSGTSNGTIEITPQGIIYTPVENYNGGDSFVYTVTDDDGGISNEATVGILVRDVNDPPTDLILSNTFVDEVTMPQSEVGTFTTVDIDPGESFSYSLVAGEGSEDNGAFSIFEDKLLSQVVFNQQQKEEYQIRVKTDDGDSSLEKTFVITVYSKQNPIGITPGELPELHPVENPVEVYPITVDEGVEIERVLFSYRGLTADRNDWEIITLEGVNRNYTGEIAAEEFDELGVQYEFVVENTDGGSINLPGFTYNQYTGGGLNFENLVFGSQQEDYNLLTVPLDLENGQGQAIFNELGTYDKTKWRLFSYENSNYLEYTEGLNELQQGRGYWLIVAEQVDISTGPGTTKLLDNQPFNLDLKQGWNLIGNPYGFTVNWLDVRKASPSVTKFIDAEIFIYDNEVNDYRQTPLWAPFQGAFVFVEEDVVLPVPLLKDPTIQPGNRIGSSYEVNDEDNWEISLNLSTANHTSGVGGLGMRQDADQSKDQYDLVRIPRFIDYLDVNFPKPEYFAPVFSKDIVPTTDRHIWEFSIETNLTDPEIILEWGDINEVEHNQEMWLYHKDKEVIIDMQQAMHYKFANQGTHNFAVYYGDKDFIESELQPDKAALAAVYPNPFSNNLTVLFTLPEKTDTGIARLSVFDLTGRKVKNLWQDQFSPGFYKVVWDGTGDSGRRLSSGTYLIRLEVNGQESIFKRVIKK